MPSSASAELSPLQRQSVARTARSPRLLTREVLAGLVTSLALIPEATAFAVVAGLDPRMGLFGSLVVAVTTAVLGGRPAMVSAAAGSVALVAAPLVASRGVPYYLAAVVLSGVLQWILAAAGAARLMKHLSPAVMQGFVNGLAVLIFTSQLPELLGVPFAVYPLTLVGLAVVFLFPKLTRAVPAPLVAILVVTGAALLCGARVPTVGERGALPDGLPVFALPQVPWDIETLGAVLPTALTMALVGLIETLLTAQLVDGLTQTPSAKTREAFGLGTANVLAGFLGCMGGCAMIGQTMINVKGSGGRTRISSACAGVFVAVLTMALAGPVAAIPMAALVAVMVFIALTTFEWSSILPATLVRVPWEQTTVMLVTCGMTVLTHNLALGVLVGVLLGLVLRRRSTGKGPDQRPVRDRPQI